MILSKQMNRQIKQSISTLAKLVLAAAIIAWLVKKDLIDFSVFQILLTPTWFLTCFGLIGITMALGSYRWQILLKTQGFDIAFVEVFKLTLIGIFFNFAIPGGVGGDLVKGFYLVKDHPERRLVAAMTVLMDRVIGLFAMVIMPATVMLFDLERVFSDHTLTLIFLSIMGLLLTFVLSFGVAFSPTCYSWIENSRRLKRIPAFSKIFLIYSAIHQYGKKQKAFWSTVFLSILAQCFSITMIWVVGQAMNLQWIPLHVYFFATTVGFIVTAVPISPAGVGIGQAAFLFLFNAYLGQKTNLGPTAVTALQMMNLLYGLGGAFFYMRWKKHAPQSVCVEGL